MTNHESLPREDKHLESGHSGHVAPAFHQDRQRDNVDRAPRRDEDQRGSQPGNAQPLQQSPSTMTILLITATVALISGVVGAMGYTHYLGPKLGEHATSQSKSGTGSNTESNFKSESDGASAKESSTQASTSSSIQGSSSAQDADGLKEQIKSLNRRIDRLGEQVDRVQQLLSLAVPLLQRIAPKN